MPSPGAISTLSRASTLDEFERGTFDLAIVGGGITGAGIAREASLRGLRVAVLEAEDFASGTSSRSSKLIHGGLRYLALGDVALVRETALERKEIFRLAPHLAERRWMVVPSRSRAGLMKLRLGVTTYEKLGAVEDADVHMNWSRDDMAEHEPLLNSETYPYACTYREYLTDDARLVLANLRGATMQGATALNHLRVNKILQEQGVASGVEAVCSESQRRITVKARNVINAAGPWIEAIRTMENAHAVKLLQLSKGVHIVFDAERLPIKNMIVVSAQDGRTIFVIRRGPVVYVGTTDTAYDEGYDVWPSITSSDVEYLLEPLPRLLDIEPLKSENVLAAWAGLRPLIAQPGKKTTEISRKDEILVGDGQVVTIAGGKLTGYRPMARRTLEEIAKLRNENFGARPDEDPLPGGDFDGDLDALAARLAQESGLGAETAIRLCRLYGTEARDVLSYGANPIAEASTIVSGEVEWAVREEGAATAEDVIYRRMRATIYDPQVRDAAIRPVALKMGELLSWDAARIDREIEGVRSRIDSELAFAGVNS